jgi:hypothetical protein
MLILKGNKTLKLHLIYFSLTYTVERHLRLFLTPKSGFHAFLFNYKHGELREI